jgi:hypothetical protein
LHPDKKGVSVNANELQRTEENFFPRGAIAFFVLMIVGFGLIWLGIYLLLLYRQSGL